MKTKPENEFFAELEYKKDKLYLILRGHIYIDNQINNLLEGFLPNPDVLELYKESFYRKVILALSLNLIEQKHCDALLQFNDFRNKYAHRLRYKVTNREIKELKESLGTIEGLEMFKEDIILGDKKNSVSDLKAIIVGLRVILGQRARWIQKCENPTYIVVD
ncbi:hypothetical protein ABEV54_05810 [Peribacillus psychrosaccharolyticus]|uniref:hypothetical protein n=1 Tax=Peribacillus psychrosaccharolyticus TaxID=1407 RepID=UPI003D28E3AD